MFNAMADDGIHAKVVSLMFQRISIAHRTLVVGAGEGALEDSLLQRGIRAHQLLAADIAPQRYKVSKVECIACDLNYGIPVGDHEFDCFIATEVIEHLDNPRQLIREAARVLKPYGTLCITTPNPGSFAQRLRYLFTGRFDYFSEADFRGSGHLHPIFDWLLDRWIRELFEVELYDSYSFHLRIPTVGRIPMPKSRLFSPSNIYLLRRLHGR